jgi:hypothetical protein
MKLHIGFPHMQLIVFLRRKCREQLLRMDLRCAIDHGGRNGWPTSGELIGIGEPRQDREAWHLLDERILDGRAGWAAPIGEGS